MDDESSLRDPGFDRVAYNAACELHYGRLEWLAYHIRHADFRIHPIVAKKLLELIENELIEGQSPPYCLFKLEAVRLPGLPAAFRDPQLNDFRNLQLAIEVARECKFRRGEILRACHKVGKPLGLKDKYVRNLIAPHRERALAIVTEEEMRAAYDRGEIDVFGRPKSE
jgi:hypothetical protein